MGDKGLAYFVLVAAVILVADLWTKAYAVAHFAGRTVTVVPHLLWFTLTENSGAAFSLFSQATGLLAVVGVIAMVAVTYLARQTGRLWTRIGWGLLMGGIVGNDVDRIWHGEVVDFIQIPHWPIFNVADSAITVGAVIVLIAFLRQGAGDKA